MLKQKKRFVDESKDVNEIHLLYKEQVKQLYKHTLIGVAATLLNSLILTYILWNVIPHVALTIWFAACLSVSFFRYLISRRFWRSSQTPTEYSKQEMWFNIGIAFSGIVWGSAGIFLFPIDSVAHQIFIAFVLGGMVAGAAGTFSIILRPFIVFSLPTLVPIIIRFFVIADHIHFAMGGMTLLFGLLMFTTAKRINTATVSSLQLQFENRGLIHQLEHRVKERTADLVETNEKLKRANEAMRESEEQLLSLLQNIQAAVVVHGPDTKILKCNKASQELLGLTEGQMLGKKADDPLWRFLNEDGSDMPLESYPVNQAIATQNVLKNVIVGVYRSNKNDVVRIIVNAVPEIDHDGNISQVIVSFMDITELKRVEEALQESEKKYSRLFHRSNDGIFLHDLDGNIIDANQKILELLGYTKTEISSITVPMLHPVEALEKSKWAFEKIIQEGFVRFEIEFCKKNGDVFSTEVSSSFFEIGGKKVIQGIVRDITKRKQAEKTIRDSEQKFNRAKRMETIGYMAGGIAHDLNNILSGIVGYPDLILMDLPENSPLRKTIEIIKGSGIRAAAIVSDLLAVARGVATKKEILNINSIIKEYIRSAEHKKLEAINPTITFKFQLDSDLLNTECSSSHIKKSLLNLVTNAAEAIQGSGTVIISTTNRYLDKPLKGYEDVHQGEYTVLTVCDDSLVEISSEDLDRIFEPFFTKKTMGRSGTGLGLTIVWNTVQDHDGYINVMRGDDRTIFELYFPITRTDVATEVEQKSWENYTGNGENILVVDDEELQREIACGLLIRLGYSATAVYSGEEAIEYLKTNSVELIVLDMIMFPGMNGRETYEKIIKVHPNQKAIIASGFAETEDVKLAQELGAGKYIKKPFTLETLAVAVNEELKKNTFKT